MAQASLYTAAGAKQTKGQSLSDAVFGVTPNQELVHQAYTIYLSNGRSAGAKTLTRGDVRGGGKKPWRQKGTGRARAGSSRLPHWTGGGVAFGPTGRENYTRSMPVKAKRAAIRQALSMQTADKRIVVLEQFTSPEGKVRPTIELLGKLEASGRVLMVVESKDNLIDRATRNVAGIDVVAATYLNVYDIMNAQMIIITQPALKVIDTWLGEAEAAAATKPVRKTTAKPAAKAEASKETA